MLALSEGHLNLNFFISPIQNIGSVILIKVLVNVNQVTYLLHSKLRLYRVFKLSLNRLILQTTIAISLSRTSFCRDRDSSSIISSPTLYTVLSVLPCLDFIVSLSLKVPLPNRLANRNTSVDDTGEKVEEGQDNHKVSETLSGVDILDVVAGIEKKQVDCNQCHYFIDKLQDELLFGLERSIDHDECHVGKV